MLKSLFSFIPRTWRVRRETAVAETTSIETRLESLGPSMDILLKLGFPQEAALDAALQLSGIPNAVSAMRLTHRHLTVSHMLL